MNPMFWPWHDDVTELVQDGLSFFDVFLICLIDGLSLDGEVLCHLFLVGFYHPWLQRLLGQRSAGGAGSAAACSSRKQRLARPGWEHSGSLDASETVP